ncbi:CAP domain-containing protein [Corynebacterium mastitidis]
MHKRKKHGALFLSTIVLTVTGAAPAAADIPAPHDTAREEAAAARLLRLTNDQRRQHGLPELRMDHALSLESHDWGELLSISGAFHHSPDAPAENLAFSPRLDAPEAILSAWMDSDGQRDNILDPTATEMGIGIHYDANGTHSVQRFR